MAWTGQSKTTSSFTPQSKTSSTFDKGVDYLLQELGDYLLQENGYKIVLNQSLAFRNPTDWTAQNKS